MGKSRTRERHETFRSHFTERINHTGGAEEVIYTFMKRTAEVGAAVALILASSAGFSSGGVLTALAPNTQLSVATLLIFSAGLEWE